MRTTSQKTITPQNSNALSALQNKKPAAKEQSLASHSALIFGNKKQNTSDENNGPLATNTSGHNFNKISILPPSSVRVQPKLKINTPGDKYEQEADKVAEQVMRMPDAGIGNISSGKNQIQRKCAACESGGTTCPKCAEEEQTIQAKESPGSTPQVTPKIGANINTLKGGGQALPQATRRFFEPRFGADFSRVRLHTNTLAEQTSRMINARAFTIGQNIVFGFGQYSPDSISGKRLLAHELTHVVQQNGSRPPGNIQRQSSPKVSPSLRRAPENFISRKQREKKLKDSSGKEVRVVQVIRPGKCRMVPKSSNKPGAGINLKQAFFVLNHCKGSFAGKIRGELNYDDALKKAGKAVGEYLLSKDKKEGLDKLGKELKKVSPQGRVTLGGQWNKIRVELGGNVSANLEGKVRGGTGVKVSGPLGKRHVIEGGVDYSGGPSSVPGAGGRTDHRVIGQITIRGGTRSSPDCRICVCSKPKVSFMCNDVTPIPAKKPVYIPLFYEYAKGIPRSGWEARYKEMINMAVGYISQGYRISRIEGRTSPEGSLTKRRGGKFEGNIALAMERAQYAKKELEAAMKAKVPVRGLFTMRAETAGDKKRAKHLKAALAATYPVIGTAPGGKESSAELFGSKDEKEVKNKKLLPHLEEKLKKPTGDQPDPLVKENVTGKHLPESIQEEVNPQIKAFRTGKRGEKTLSDKDRLDAIYRQLRRALIVLNPPVPSRKEMKQGMLKVSVGNAMPCKPEHEAVFNNVKIPEDWWFEGNCKEGKRTQKNPLISSDK